MQYTQNYNLNKPEGNDYAKISALNENVDIIDAELKSLNNAIGTGTASDTILVRLNKLEDHVGNLANLETTQKANLVAAINDVRQNLLNKAVLKGEGYIADANNIEGMSTRVLPADGLNGPPVASDGWATILTASAVMDNDRAFQLGQKWNDTDGRLWYRRRGSDWEKWSQVLTHSNTRKPLGQDFDNFKITGLYALSDKNINGPNNEDAWGMLQVYTSGDYISQVYYGLAGTYERQYVSGAWKQWKRILTQDDYDQLFQFVSNGKIAVNQAVTDMGEYTAPDASFATTAANIRKLSNILSGTGTVTSNSSQTFFNVSGLSFRPRAFMFRARGGNIPSAWGVHNGTWSASEFIVVIGNNSYASISSVFQGGFNVAAAYPGGTGQFDWWAIK